MVFLVSKRKRHRLSIPGLTGGSLSSKSSGITSKSAQQRLNHLNHPAKIVVEYIYTRSSWRVASCKTCLQPFWIATLGHSGKLCLPQKPAKAVHRNRPLPFMGLYYSYIPFPINWKASLCLHAQGADEVVGTPAIDGACMERWDLDFTLRRRMRRGNVWKVTNRSWKKNG